MSDDNTSPVLRMESVRKTFGTSVVLRDVDLEVPPHTVTALIGASGSGKSTLLRCANLLEDIDDGAIWLDGDEITAALDPELVGEVLAVVRDLKDEGMTMVLATHEMGFARDVADQVCFLDGGVVLERGTAQQIFGDPQQERTQRFLRRIVEAGRL